MGKVIETVESFGEPCKNCLHAANDHRNPFGSGTIGKFEKYTRIEQYVEKHSVKFRMLV